MSIKNKADKEEKESNPKLEYFLVYFDYAWSMRHLNYF